jgi:hypothetical protein
MKSTHPRNRAIRTLTVIGTSLLCMTSISTALSRDADYFAAAIKLGSFKAVDMLPLLPGMLAQRDDTIQIISLAIYCAVVFAFYWMVLRSFIILCGDQVVTAPAAAPQGDYFDRYQNASS